MKLLILSCNTGQGHNAAGKAVAEEMERQGIAWEMKDVMQFAGSHTSKTVEEIYVKVTTKTPWLFEGAYKAGEWISSSKRKSPVYLANIHYAHSLYEYIRQEKIDGVVMPHLFPAEAMTYIRRHFDRTIPCYGIATDYTCIPFTEETECDAYVIPSAGLAESFTGRGLPAGKLYPLGIPVRRCFSQGESRSEARTRLGLDPDRKYILAAGGSMGGGEIKKAIYALADLTAGRADTELIIICGSNRQLYDELKALSLPKVTVIGFTTDMAGYMKAADLFVSKPGGLSSTEAAVCGVPLVHVAEIPGCETFNAQYFSSRGMSRLCSTSGSGLQAALELLDDPLARDEMLKSQKALVPENAAAQICALAEYMAMLQEDGNVSIPEIVRPATS